MNVIKRDGTVVEFDRNKITFAIKKALEACDMASDTIALSVTEDVVQAIGDVPEIDQEAVLDLVQEALMKRGLLKVAIAFTRYRERHAMARGSNIELINGVFDKISAKHIENSNANVDEASFDGRAGEAADFVFKKLALDFCMSDVTKNNHVNNYIYLHDLQKYLVGSHNCLTIPFTKLFEDGFSTRQTGIRGPQSISSALQLLAVIMQIQSLQQFGGVSSSATDFQLVPYVRKSLRKHYLKRALEDYMFNRDSFEISEDPSEELKAVLWKYPTKESWYALDDEVLDGIIEVFGKWYQPLVELVDSDFTFVSSKLQPTRKMCAVHDTRYEARQAIEGLLHNLNSLQSRSSGQLPFSSLNYGTCTEPEGRMITELLLKGIIAGTGYQHSTPIFPCGIFIIKNGINKKPGDPNYDLFLLALKATSLRLYPNYANGDWSSQVAWLKYDRDMKADVISQLDESDKAKLKAILSEKSEVAYKLTLKEDLSIDPEERPYEQMSTMGCRTVNGADINARESYEKAIQDVLTKGDTDVDILSAIQKDGRGNICPATIILPELAMIANKDVEVFMQVLEQKINEAMDSLVERFNRIASQPAASAKFMYNNHTMAGYVPEEGIISALKHGTLAIGQLGLAECLQILIGTDQTTPEGMELAKRIEQLFKDKCAAFKQDLKLNVAVYMTPAEGLCYTAMKKFQAKYGKIPNVSDREFFTNSMHVPVWRRMDPFKKIDIESQLTGYSSGGCITYVELDVNVKNNIEALEKLVVYAMEKDIPYFAINVPNDHCESCGYIGDIPDNCPKCGSSDIMRLRRVTGYLSTTYKHFNPGKQAEVEARVKHIG